MFDSLTNFGTKLSTALSDVLSAPDMDFVGGGGDATPVYVPRYEDDVQSSFSPPSAPVIGRPMEMPASASSVLASASAAVSSAVSSVTSGAQSLISKVTGSASSATGAKASGSSSSWTLWLVLAAAAACAWYLIAKPKGRGKSFFPKLGGKSSVKLH